MRKLIEREANLFCQYPDHEVSEKYRKISNWLVKHPSIHQRVAEDLGACLTKTRGAKGTSADTVVRCALYQASETLTFRGLEFALQDSSTAKAFCRVDFGESISDSTLCTLIGQISENTWAHMQFLTVKTGLSIGLESGRKVRMDATVIDANIHHPTDSGLLVDALRCVSRVAGKMRKAGGEIYTRYSHKSAKRRELEILNAKNEQVRLGAYKALISKAKEVLYQRGRFLEVEKELGVNVEGSFGTLSDLFNALELVLDQATRRVLNKERVPADEKLVSIFEPHCDIIVKDRRETRFGHKVMLTTGPSRLIIDFEVLKGNPLDAVIFENSLTRAADVTGRIPTQIATDGGFSSLENLEFAKELGVKDVAFSKYQGLGVLDMCKSIPVFKKLRNFRAGIEGDISNLKRGYDISKATWKGFDGFSRQCWSRVCAYNLSLLATQ